MTAHALETGHPAIVYCRCCDAPALAVPMAVEDELGNDLSGGVSVPVTCLKCVDPATAITTVEMMAKGGE